MRFALLLTTAAIVAGVPAQAQSAGIIVPAQPVSRAVAAFARQAHVQVIVSASDAAGRQSKAVDGNLPVEIALAKMLEGTGLVPRLAGPGSWVIVRARLAQPAETPASAPAPAEAPVAEPVEIVVTAQRIAQPLSKVPASIVALTQDRLDQIGARDFYDIARFTPGVRIRPEINQIAIRGIASNAGAATTGVYIDETPIQVRTFGEGVSSALPFLFDLDRVEVLRGPQGTLFGSGSLGGTVRYITTQPSLDRTSIYGRAEVAATQSGSPSYEGGVAIGGPVIDGVLGARVAASHRRSGGWVDRIDAATNALRQNDANYIDTTTLRGSLRFEPAPGLTITPSVFYQLRYKNDTDYFWPRSRPQDGVYVNGNPVALVNRDRFVLPSLTIAYEGNGVEVVANTGFFIRRQVRQYDNTLYNFAGYENFRGELLTADGPNFNILPGNLISTGRIDNAQDNFTQELRIQSNQPDARLRWVLGAFYSNNRQRNIETLIEPSLEQFFQAIYGTGVVGIQIGRAHV